MVLLRSNDLLVTVAPEHGFTIGSIALADDGQNVLWNPPDASFHALTQDAMGPTGEESIDHFDRHVLAGGWFPMFPTAGPPGTARDRRMHGELPRLAWQVGETTAARVTATVALPISGMRAERSVRVERNTVTVQTRVWNVSDETQHVTMGEHPCFPRTVFAGGVLHATPTRGRVPSLADPANALLAGERAFTWPMATAASGELTNVSAVPDTADGRHEHIMLIGLDRVEIRGAAYVVDLQWDGKAFPNVMLWQHFQPSGSPWNGDVFAIEPVSADGRTFDEAVATGTVTELKPGEEIATWMSLRVQSAA